MRIDCVVASIADAKSLAGGYLLQTPLYGADGKVYAVAQGSVIIGGEDVKLSSNLQKRYRVVGYLPEGAIVERDIPSDMLDGDSVTILLRQPDITTAARVARAINEVRDGSRKGHRSIRHQIDRSQRSRMTSSRFFRSLKR